MRFLVAIVMIFSSPVRFSDALDSRAVRSLLPTSLTSAELEQISADILERATFSARVTNAEYLQTIDDVVEQFLTGKTNLATARLALKQKLEEIGYAPSEEDRGTLRDFSSDERTNLVLRINSEMASGYGTWLQNQDPAVLDQWPAQELIRVSPRRVPRDWEARWTDEGGQIFESEPDGPRRMIALRNTPIWTRISRFGLPYPPFDFNSGMGTRLVPRRDAMKFGLIDRDTVIKPETRGLNDDLKFTPEIREKALRQALEEEGYQFDEGGSLSLGPTGGLG